jgi:hypothetical protein
MKPEEMSSNKELAVIILNWNGINLLKQFLPTAVKYTINDNTDLIVADNGSTDDSVEWIKNNCPEVKLVIFNENYGFAGGYNRAIKATNYKYTLLLNSDVEVTKNWTVPLLDFMHKNPSAGACQPKIRAYKQKDYFEYAGAAGGLLDKNGYPFCRGRLFDSIEKDNGQYNGNPVPVAWASGAALMVRTEAYLKVGGLDEKFFAHMEEIDLCCRMVANGYGVYALSDSLVYHVGGASLAQGNPRKTYLNFRNNLLLMHKNMPRKTGARKIFRRQLLDGLAAVRFLLSGDVANFRAVWNAHRDFRKMRPQYTDFPNSDILATLPGADRNILIDYFIFKKKR